MRLVRCGLFVLILVVGTQLYWVSSWYSPYLPAATMFLFTLSLTALITWVGLRLVDWMVLEKRHRSEEFLFDIRERFESASAFGSY